ncbi:hypothetical protein Tco_1300347 [Tanacetum coccineum]
MASFDDTKKWDDEHTNSPMITNSKLEIGDEFLKILQDNTFNGMDGGDVVDHITKSKQRICSSKQYGIFWKLNMTYCMTRSSTKELITPFENPKRVFRSKMRLFETPVLVESSSPEFDLYSDIEEHSEE